MFAEACDFKLDIQIHTYLIQREIALLCLACNEMISVLCSLLTNWLFNELV